MYVTFEDIRTFDVVGHATASARSGGEADEPLGKLHDLYIDTRDWRVSWLVLDSGSLLTPRKVLIGTENRVAFDTDARRLLTSLTPYDVETASEAGELRTAADVEAEGGGAAEDGGLPTTGPSAGLPSGAGGGAGSVGSSLMPEASAPLPPSEEERHLRSARELLGYTVIGQGEEAVGPVADLLVDTDSPTIAWLSVDVGSWLAGRQVVIRPDWTGGISWSERRVAIDLSREQVRGAPPLETLGGLDRAYASSLARFYRLPPL